MSHNQRPASSEAESQTALLARGARRRGFVGKLHHRRTGPPRRRWVFSAVVGAIIAIVVGLWVYAANVHGIDIVAVELGGADQNWPLPAGTAHAVRWDYVFIAGYGVALW